MGLLVVVLDLTGSRGYPSSNKMSTIFKAPRGTKDILPADQGYWTYVYERAISVSHLYGYQRIDTPAFENTSLFLRSVGEETDIVEKQMYTFEDRGGDKVTLRPEGTAPVCRAYIEHGMHNLPQPVRLFYFGAIFRYERPQAGRLRQHQQFGCEAIGSADPAVDAEIVDVAWRLYSTLGLTNLNIHLNSIGCQACRSQYLEKLRAFYSGRDGSLCPDCTKRLQRSPLRLLDCKNPACHQIAMQTPRILDYLCDDCRQHFDTLRDYLNLLKIPYDIDPYLVRGLDYYTRTVFEVQPSEVGGQSAVGGGGRYDNLIELLGGRPTPAVGFGTGIERILLNLQKQAIPAPAAGETKVYIAHLGEEARRAAIGIAATLRQAGTGVTLATEHRSLKAQLKHANALGLPRAIIIGEEEIRTQTAILRDMTRGEQIRVSLDRLVSELKK